MHIFFQNNQYLGSYYFTRSADDPVDNLHAPEQPALVVQPQFSGHEDIRTRAHDLNHFGGSFALGNFVEEKSPLKH